MHTAISEKEHTNLRFKPFVVEQRQCPDLSSQGFSLKKKSLHPYQIGFFNYPSVFVPPKCIEPSK